MACSEQDYEYLREVVRTHSANVVGPSRNALFDARLAPVARDAGTESLEALVKVLQGDRPGGMRRAVAEAMTINETSFFRDRPVYEALRVSVIPELIERRQDVRRLRIWSAASSTGQEAYSVAMLLFEHFPELSQWDVSIYGTDIARSVVEYARAGLYRRLEVNRGLPVRMLLKYFRREGEEWLVTDRLKRMCTFEVMSLCEPSGAEEVFDLILLRNVLLYLHPGDRRVVLQEARRQLAMDGYLLLGSSEQAEDSSRQFEACFLDNCCFYRAAE